MGRMRAEEMIEYAGIELALRDHLQYNHFPPVSLAFLETAKAAISEVQNGNGDEMLSLPNGKQLSAWQVIEGLHLEPFCLSDER